MDFIIACVLKMKIPSNRVPDYVRYLRTSKDGWLTYKDIMAVLPYMNEEGVGIKEPLEVDNPCPELVAAMKIKIEHNKTPKLWNSNYTGVNLNLELRTYMWKTTISYDFTFYLPELKIKDLDTLHAWIVVLQRARQQLDLTVEQQKKIALFAKNNLQDRYPEIAFDIIQTNLGDVPEYSEMTIALTTAYPDILMGEFDPLILQLFAICFDQKDVVKFMPVVTIADKDRPDQMDWVFRKTKRDTPITYVIVIRMQFPRPHTCLLVIHDKEKFIDFFNPQEIQGTAEMVTLMISRQSKWFNEEKFSFHNLTEDLSEKPPSRLMSYLIYSLACEENNDRHARFAYSISERTPQTETLEALVHALMTTFIGDFERKQLDYIWPKHTDLIFQSTHNFSPVKPETTILKLLEENCIILVPQ